MRFHTAVSLAAVLEDDGNLTAWSTPSHLLPAFITPVVMPMQWLCASKLEV